MVKCLCLFEIVDSLEGSHIIMNKSFTMKELPVSEKPYEKCEKLGAGALTDAELLAVILKTGTKNKTSIMLATEVLMKHPVYKGLLGLHHLTRKELSTISGIGKVKAVQLSCVVELAKRLAKEKKQDSFCFSEPYEVAGYFMEDMRNLETEHIVAAFFDAAGHLLHHQTVFKGTIYSAMANPREILRLALQFDAAQYVVLHNHPSGVPTPSIEDFNVTKRLQKASDLVGIPLMDHIIIGDNQYVSLKERGYI